jgi:hypothetical protein
VRTVFSPNAVGPRAFVFSPNAVGPRAFVFSPNAVGLRAFGLLTVLLALPAFAAGKQLTLIFEGDNGGEVAPCG